MHTPTDSVQPLASTLAPALTRHGLKMGQPNVVVKIIPRDQLGPHLPNMRTIFGQYLGSVDLADLRLCDYLSRPSTVVWGYLIAGQLWGFVLVGGWGLTEVSGSWDFSAALVAGQQPGDRIVFELMVHPLFQKTGIGRQLLQRVREHWSMSRVVLGCREDVKGFYSKCGFERVGWITPAGWPVRQALMVAQAVM